MASTKKLAAALAVTGLGLSGIALGAAPQAAADDWTRCLEGPADRQATFERAADVSGVPVQVLLGVSFLETRWDDHGSAPSYEGGFGPMHLTLDAAPSTPGGDGKGGPGA